MSISCAECKPIGIEKNFLLVKCNLCAKDMMLTEGSVIIGSKWYHENCFDMLNSNLTFTKDPKHNIENKRRN